jgi:hypothetical protein
MAQVTIQFFEAETGNGTTVKELNFVFPDGSTYVWGDLVDEPDLVKTIKDIGLDLSGIPAEHQISAVEALLQFKFVEAPEPSFWEQSFTNALSGLRMARHEARNVNNCLGSDNVSVFRGQKPPQEVLRGLDIANSVLTPLDNAIWDLQDHLHVLRVDQTVQALRFQGVFESPADVSV